MYYNLNPSHHRHRLAFYGFRQGSGAISQAMLGLINDLAAFTLQIDLLLHGTAIPELGQLAPSIHLIPLGLDKSWRGVLALARYLSESRPDALVALRDKANRRALRARRLAGSRARIIMRVGMAPSSRLAGYRTLKRWRRLYRLKQAYRANDMIIADSLAVREDVVRLTGLGPKAVRLIPDTGARRLLEVLQLEECVS
jgi:hypothetical protein